MNLHHMHILPQNAPGELVPLGAQNAHHSPKSVTVLGYGPTGYEERTDAGIEVITELRAKWPVVWVDVDGLGNTQLITSIGDLLGLDRLVLEDIFDTHQIPKSEEYDQYLLTVIKNGLFIDGRFQSEQIAMILTKGLLVTFQECPGDSFEQLRKRIRGAIGRVRQFGADYLLYAVVDAVIESYYPILENIKCQLDSVEELFIKADGGHVIRRIHELKYTLLLLHSAVWPVHDVLLALNHEDVACITPATTHFLRDCQDQAKRVTDLSEFYRLLASDLMNTYLAFSDNKANQIMKVLTMVSTIFIPLSFIASVYGMNFDTSVSRYNMPELKSRFGYPTVLSVMFAIACVLLVAFWRAGWLGRKRVRAQRADLTGRAKRPK